MKRQSSENTGWENIEAGMINPGSPTPMYVQIFELLRSQILMGKVNSGEKLPSEKVLGQQLNVSRITIRQALSLLDQEGLTYTVQGKGTFTRRSPINVDLMHITSFGEIIREKGLVASTVLLGFDDNTTRKQSHSWPEELGAWSNACLLELLGLVSGQPAVYFRSFIRSDIGEKIYSLVCEKAEREAFSTFSLYEEIGCRVNHINQNVFAVEADLFLSQTLDIPVGKALLKLESLVHDMNDSVLEYKIAYYRADKYSFNLVRSGN